MKDLYIKVHEKIKMALGLCNSKGCHKKATANIYFKQIDVKRNLCNKHLLEIQKMDFINSTFEELE